MEWERRLSRRRKRRMAMGKIAATEVSTSGVDPAVRVLNVLHWGQRGYYPGSKF